MPEPSLPSSTLSLGEAAARRVLLAQAVEVADTHGKLVSAIEREQIEQAALEATRRGNHQSPDRESYLLARAQRLLDTVANRDPRVAALQQAEPWQRWVAWGLPLLALVLGASFDRIDNPQQVNMLSPPLVAFLLWNVLIYIALALAPLLPRGRQGDWPLGGLRRWLAAAPSLEGTPRRLSGRLRADVLLQFRLRWWRVAGALEGWRVARTLHASAAAWAIGVALSIAIGGLVREYRVGWESTLLDLSQVHAFLSLLFSPVVALLPIEGFSLADLQRMHLRSGAAVTRDEARHWVALYLALLGVVVVVPRLALALYAQLRRRLLGRAIELDLREPYFEEMLARVSPVLATLALVAADAQAGGFVLRVLRQATDSPASLPPPAPAAWTVLSTARGDELRVLQLQPGTPATDAGGGDGRGWRDAVQGWWSRGATASDASLRAPAADADVVLVAVASAADVDAVGPLLRAWARPVLLLHTAAPDAVDGLRAAADRHGLQPDLLALADCAANWLREAGLREAVARRLPRHKAPGMARLTQCWRERHEARFDAAMRTVAAYLVQAARDTQDVQAAGPVSLRRLVNPDEREAGQQARVEGAAALAARIEQARAHAERELVRLHGLDDLPELTALAPSALHERFVLRQGVHAPQAGVAGAASGAATGAAVDLMTGGLTLGAATALGALVGGGAALVAASWKNRATPGGNAVLVAGDEVMLALAEEAVARYLVLIAAGRPGDAQDPSRGERSARGVQQHRDALHALWTRAREPAADADDVVRQLANELRKLVMPH